MAFRGHKESKKSTFRKEKERISKRFQMNLEAIIAKYDHPFDGSDVLDLNDMTIVEDRGFLSGRKQMKIGMTKLASDKASSVSRSGIRWNSTKNSTDSAIGSTRYSESEDTSGTETITNYSSRIPSIDSVVEDDKADLRHGDVLMRNDSLYEDSGNEDADSDHSGPIRTPLKSPLHSGLPQRHQRNQDSVRDSVKQASRPSVRGNLSRRFDDAEDSMKPKRGLLCRARSLGDEDEEEEDDDPYEFREELPSILEEKNKFLFKMQSILVDSFLDGDEIDEMDSQTDDEVSTETIESTEAVSGSISAWSTLPLRTPPKRSSKNPEACQQNVDAVARKILTPRKAHGQKLSERDTVSSTDSDLTECSTILAGNLHDDRDDPPPSKLLLATGQERDSLRSRGSKAPFQAICNSTMLSEISPFEEADMLDRKSPLDLDKFRGQEVPLDGQGEMYLGEVPEIDNSNLKAHSLDEEGSKTPKAVNDFEYSTPRRPRLHVQSQEVPRGDENGLEKDRGKSRTPSTRNHSWGDGRMDPEGQDVSGFTPRARLRRGVSFKQTPQSLSSPRFDTNEIMEIFKSPKPLIIPGVDLNDLELTPQRKVKREAAATPTEPFRDTLLRLQSPVPQQKVDQTNTPRRQKAKEIRLLISAQEVAVECAAQGNAAVSVKDGRDIDLSKRIVDLEDGRRRQGMKTADEFFEDVSDMSPKVRKVPKSLKGDRRGSASPISKKPEISRKTVEKIQAPTPTHPTHGVDQKATPKSKRRGERQPNKQTCHDDQEKTNSDIRPDNSCHQKHAGDFPSGRTLGSSSGTKRSIDNALDQCVCPTSRKSHPQPREATTEKPPNRPRPSRQTPNKEFTPDTQQRKPATSLSSEITPRSRRSDECPMTSAGQFSPSTLSSPFVHMSLASPSNLNGQKQDKLASDIKSKRPTVLGTRKNERSTVKQTQAKSAKEPAKAKSRTSGLNRRSRLDCTHMTIRYSDDTSEEEMEVDPYSLTADDSSLSPNLHQRRPELQPKGKPKITKGDRPHKSTVGLKNCEHRTKGENHSKPSTQDCSKNLTSVIKKSFSKDKVSEVMKTSERSSASGPSRSSVNGRNSGNLTDSRKSHAAVRNTQSLGKSKMYSGVRKSPQDSPPPSPIYKISTVPPEKERTPEKSSKYATRKEHSKYLSDEESNSSGDSAKFLSSIPHRDWRKDASDADWLTNKCMSPKRSGHSEQAVVSKHRTTIKCGQIISTPKSAKAIPMGSPSRQHRAHSPSHKGRVEKARKALISSPKRTYRNIELQSENMPSRTSSRLVSGGQVGIKMAAQKLMASPSSRRGDVLREDMSSPLRASGCNVSSSYVCEGPGLCTKPFCFSCALGQIS